MEGTRVRVDSGRRDGALIEGGRGLGKRII